MTKQYHLTTLDVPGLSRVALGFDRLFDDLNRQFANSVSTNYPPYNVVRKDENNFVIEVAVAGFGEDELDVQLKDGTLIITGSHSGNEQGPEYLHQGISRRDFTRSFLLDDHMEVREASVKNGMLSIALERIVPEEEKPRKIAITFQK